MIHLDKVQIDDAVTQVAKQLSTIYMPKYKVIALIVMDGAMFFASDLLRKMPDIDFFIHTVKVKSYTGFNQSKESIIESFPPPSLIEDQDILIIDDIFETGQTIERLTNSLARFNPRSVRSCTLLSRGDSHPNMYGIELVSGEWLKGYGMNNGRGTERHLQGIQTC